MDRVRLNPLHERPHGLPNRPLKSLIDVHQVLVHPGGAPLILLWLMGGVVLHVLLIVHVLLLVLAAHVVVLELLLLVVV